MTSDLSKLLYIECQQLEKEAADIQERISEDRGRLSVLQRRLEHIRALLSDEGTSGPPSAGQLAQHNHVNGTGSSVCDIAAEVLSERNGAPMYYKDLAGEVIKRGGPLQGETPWASLTARMVLDPRFVRPTAKGFYALRSDYPTARNVGARVRGNRRGRGS